MVPDAGKAPGTTGFGEELAMPGLDTPRFHTPLSDTVLDQLFRQARTHNAWQDRPIDDEELRALAELLKWGPTSANCSPARILFLKSASAKEEPRPHLIPDNVEKPWPRRLPRSLDTTANFTKNCRNFFPTQAPARGLPAMMR